MLRSLYAGISGLRAEQTMLDVTSNNIANVNTVGFKASSVHFTDTLSQTLQSAGLAQSLKAGTNPSQIGLGVKVSDIAVQLTQGSQQSTGSNLDTMISGDGYFVTKVGSQSFYTRNGSMHFDAQGRLSTADGGLVQGWTATNGTVNTGLAPTNITYSQTAVAPAKATTKAEVNGNIPNGAANGDTFRRDITVYGQDGAPKVLNITFTKNAGGWAYSAANTTTAANGTTTTGTASTGQLNISATGGVTHAPTTGAGAVEGVALDFTGLTGFAGLNTTTLAEQDGRAAGTLLSYTMGADGTLTGTYSNGDTVPLARLALATFTNPAGLSKAGDSTFTESINSGQPKMGTAGADGYGAITAGALEASNVDLSQEFTNLIVAQRGFQANARIITTSDEILQELTQLKR